MSKFELDVRIVHPHDDLECDYHEWYNEGRRVKANCLGIPNPRMYSTYWTRWRCNNVDCRALAYVNDRAVQRMIKGAE